MSSLAKITSHIELLSRINTKRSRIDYLMGNNILTIIYDYLMGNNSDMVMVSWMSGSGGSWILPLYYSSSRQFLSMCMNIATDLFNDYILLYITNGVRDTLQTAANSTGVTTKSSCRFTYIFISTHIVNIEL